MSADQGGPPLASSEVMGKTRVSSVDSRCVRTSFVEGRAGVKTGASGEGVVFVGQKLLGPLLLSGWWDSLGGLSPGNGALVEWEV